MRGTQPLSTTMRRRDGDATFSPRVSAKTCEMAPQVHQWGTTHCCSALRGSFLATLRTRMRRMAVSLTHMMVVARQPLLGRRAHRRRKHKVEITLDLTKHELAFAEDSKHRGTYTDLDTSQPTTWAGCASLLPGAEVQLLEARLPM